MKTSQIRWAMTAMFAALAFMVAGCSNGSAQPSSSSDPLALQPAPDVPQLPADNSAQGANGSGAPTVAVPGEEKPAPVVPPLSPALSDVIRLVQSDVGQDVVMSYVKNSTGQFSIGAAQMDYLNDLGVPNEVALAMIQRDNALAPQTASPTAVPASAPPPQVVTADSGPDMAGPAPGADDQVVQVAEPPPVADATFYGELSPYGSWVDVDGYGRCWQPTVVMYQSTWQPYCDNGHWVYSNRGWYWVSDYSWGVTFHYGRWFRDSRRGWCWAPDNVWAPAWVTWRASSDYCGWAPLPPRSGFVAGVGLTFNGGAVAVGFGFGLASDCYTFVPRSHFIDRRPRQYALSHDRGARVINQTTVINNFGGRDNHHIINTGIARSTIPGAPAHSGRSTGSRTDGHVGNNRPSGGQVVGGTASGNYAVGSTGAGHPPHDVPQGGNPSGNHNWNGNNGNTGNDRNNTVPPVLHDGSYRNNSPGAAIAAQPVAQPADTARVRPMPVRPTHPSTGMGYSTAGGSSAANGAGQSYQQGNTQPPAAHTFVPPQGSQPTTQPHKMQISQPQAVQPTYTPPQVTKPQPVVPQQQWQKQPAVSAPVQQPVQPVHQAVIPQQTYRAPILQAPTRVPQQQQQPQRQYTAPQSSSAVQNNNNGNSQHEQGSRGGNKKDGQ